MEHEGEYSPLRIIHLPTDVGGNAYGLSRGERALGYTSDVLVRSKTSYAYPSDRQIVPHTIHGKRDILAHIPSLLREVYRTSTQYDVIHCNYGSSLLDISPFPTAHCALLDIPLYAAAGKVIAVTYNGCDARQKDMITARKQISACHEDTCYGGACMSGLSADRVRSRIKKMARYADITYALNPDIIPLLPEGTQFLPYTIAHWGFIKSLRRPMRIREYGCDDPFTIVHAPSDRGAKGSPYILPAIKEIETEYHGHVRVILVENASHMGALAMYRRADLVIDQVLVGWYGAVTVESLAMGIPAIAYIHSDDLDVVPRGMASDVTHAIISPPTPRSIKDTVLSLIDDPHLLAQYRENGMAYVDRWHDPIPVARETTRAYMDAARGDTRP